MKHFLAKATVLALAVGTLGVVAPVSAAEEFYPRPWSGSYVFDGHGYGHGIGMSQWGAYGAAVAGKSWSQILDFYYPGTTKASIGNPKIRVDLRGDLGEKAEFFPGGTLSYTRGPDHLTGGALPTVGSNGATITRWRITGPSVELPTDPSSADLSYLTGSTWTHYKYTSHGSYNITSSTGTVNARTTAGTAAPIKGEFRGIRIAEYSRINPVAYISMDTYLNGVVPYEVFTSWPLNAQAAQSVAARTYAAYALDHPRFAPYYDICDTTSCQVFKGRAWVSATSAAIAATNGTAMLYGGDPALAMFSASNGGWMVAGSEPYLVAKADPYDGVSGNSNHDWAVTISVDTIEDRWPSIGTLSRLRITSRTGNGEWGGYVNTLVVEGSAGSVTVSGDTARGILGLKSRWFRPRPSKAATSYPRDLSGDKRADLVVMMNSGQMRRYSFDASGSLGGYIVLGEGYASTTRALSGGAWDGDALSDVLTLTEAGNLYFRRSTTSGLAAKVLIREGWTTYDSVFPMGDFSGDGMSDLIVRRSDGALRRYSSSGNGGFGAPSDVVGTGFGVFDLVTGGGPLTADGYADVLAREPSGRLWVYPGDGHDGFTARIDAGTGWGGYTDLVGLGRVDADTKADLVGLDGLGQLWLIPGTGTGTFGPRRLIASRWTGVSHLAP